MRIAILHKKCFIKNKIRIVYFNYKLCLILCNGAIEHSYLTSGEHGRIFWISPNVIIKYLNSGSRHIINFGMTVDEFSSLKGHLYYLSNKNNLAKESLKLFKSLTEI